MSYIIAKNDCSSSYDTCNNTYFSFNGAILVLHYWAGNGGDEENPYEEESWTVYHDDLAGNKDLLIWWSKYESGNVQVFTVDHPEGFDPEGLKEFLDYELGIEMPTSKK